MNQNMALQLHVKFKLLYVLLKTPFCLEDTLVGGRISFVYLFCLSLYI
jgi:hypothetical protein